MASSIGSVSCLVDSAKITRRFARSFFETTNSLIVWPLLSLSFRSILEQFFDRPPIADPSRPLPLELTLSADRSCLRGNRQWCALLRSRPPTENQYDENNEDDS